MRQTIENIETEMAESKGKYNPHVGVVSIQLHGVKLLDDANVSIIDNILKTYNSASRCSFKHFQKISLKDLLKSHKTPNKRKFMSKFKNVPMVDGKPMCYECPTGMSEDMWLKMREESYRKKALAASNNASKFWQIDKDLGSPIMGTEQLVREWVKSNGYELDSILLHNAILNGFKNYKSFERQKSKYRTDKETPCFGDAQSRSKKKITHDEYELTRNSSFTVVGKKKVGNPKFKFNIDDCTAEFTFKRKKIGFSFKSHRFSKKGLKHISNVMEMMEQGKLAVTVTLTKVSKDTYTMSLAYSPSEMDCSKPNEGNPNIVTGIWFSGEAIHHQIMDVGNGRNKILHERTYKVEDFTGERKSRKLIEHLKYNEEYSTIKRIRKNLRNKMVSGTRYLLKKIFNISHAYGSSAVVVETPSSKTKRNFNSGFIGFDKFKVSEGNIAPCHMNQGTFLNMVKSQCIKNGMALKKVNGAFIQLNAVLAAGSMKEAIRKATSEMVARASKGQGICLTKTGVEQVISSNPSMLDWVGHLLHNKRNRQARCEVKRAFHSRAVEKAARLLDKRHRRSCVGN